MSAIDWPETLPQLLSASDFTHTLADNVLATEMDVGPPKRRLRSLANEAPLAGSMIMTSAQWADLETFYIDTVSGVLPFNFPDPDDDEETIEVIFAAPPGRRYSSPGKWRVSLQLRIQP